MSISHDFRYDLKLSNASEQDIALFAKALSESRLAAYIEQDPEEPSVFTSDVMEYSCGGLPSGTIEELLHELTNRFPEVEFHLTAEDLDKYEDSYELKFHGDLFQRADYFASCYDFSPPVPFEDRHAVRMSEFNRHARVNELTDVITKKIDYDLLYAQKLALLDHLENGTPIPKMALEGLVNLLVQMGDLGEAMGRFRYDGIEPPFPMQSDYVKKTVVFPSEQSKVHLLCEELERDDAIREFRVLATSHDKDYLKKLLQAKVARDDYGFIAKNGVDEDSATHFSTEFNDGFVEYYILEEDVLSRDQLESLLQSPEYSLETPAPQSKAPFDTLIADAVKRQGSQGMDQTADHETQIR